MMLIREQCSNDIIELVEGLLDNGLVKINEKNT